MCTLLAYNILRKAVGEEHQRRQKIKSKTFTGTTFQAME